MKLKARQLGITAALIEELVERNQMLSDIALSAIALKLNIEHGFPPSLHALQRDLDAFHRRFGGVGILDRNGDGHEDQEKK